MKFVLDDKIEIPIYIIIKTKQTHHIYSKPPLLLFNCYNLKSSSSNTKMDIHVIYFEVSSHHTPPLADFDCTFEILSESSLRPLALLIPSASRNFDNSVIAE